MYVPVVTLSTGDDNNFLDQLKSGFKRTIKEVEIKDFNVLIDGKIFFDVPVKKKEAYENIIEISKNNDYTTGKLLDYQYFLEHYKLIAINLSKQIKLENTNLKE